MTVNSFKKKRPLIYIFLINILISSFVFSYAINSISIILLFVFFFTDSKDNIKYKFKTLKNNKIVVIYVLFFLAQLLGMFYTQNTTTGWVKIQQFLPVFFLPLIAFSEKFSRNQFILNVEFLKVFFTLFFIMYLIFHVFVENQPIGTFVFIVINNKLGMSQFYLAVILLIPFLHCLNQIEHKENRSYNLILSIFFFFCLIILKNKTTIFILGLTLLFKAFLFLKNKFTIIKTIGIVSLLIGVFLSTIFFVPGLKKKFAIIAKTTDFNIETIITKNKVTHTKNTLEHRVLINNIALKEIKKSFLFGVGTGDYLDLLYFNYKKIYFKQGIRERYNNHNQYFSEFLKTGVFGGVLFIVLIFLLLKSASNKDVFFVYLIMFFSIACFFESYLERQHGILIFSFILPLFLKFDKKK
jgi:O-antigen ligase